MRAKVAKRLRKEIKDVYEAENIQLSWESYQGIRSAQGKQQIVLVECQKALYREVKKDYYKEKSVSQ